MPSGPPEHHLPIPSSRSAAIRDGQRGPCGALIYLLRFLRFLRNDLSVEIVRSRRVAGAGQGQPPAPSKSGNRLPSSAPLNRTQKGFFAQVLTTMGRATRVPGIL